MTLRHADTRAARAKPSTAPGARPVKCRWCPIIRDTRGIHTHERNTHPAEYQAAKDGADVTYTDLAARAAEPPTEYLKKIPEKHGKVRVPDPALDDLLGRLDSLAHTPAGIEMYARADKRTKAEREALQKAHPVFNGCIGSILDRGVR